MLLLLNTARLNNVEYLEQRNAETIYYGERINKTVLKNVSYNLTYNLVVTAFCNLYTQYRFWRLNQS